MIGEKFPVNPPDADVIAIVDSFQRYGVIGRHYIPT